MSWLDRVAAAAWKDTRVDVVPWRRHDCRICEGETIGLARSVSRKPVSSPARSGFLNGGMNEND